MQMLQSDWLRAIKLENCNRLLHLPHEINLLYCIGLRTNTIGDLFSKETVLCYQPQDQ